MKYLLSMLLALVLLACVGCASPGRSTLASDMGDAVDNQFEYFYFDSGDLVDIFCLNRENFQYFWGLDGGEVEED